MEAKAFFMAFLNADCQHIAVENPVPLKLVELPPYTQIIQPWMFGDNFNKTTWLWIKGLPSLVPEITEPPQMEWKEWVDKKTGKIKRQNKWYYDAFCKCKPEERGKLRSKTFPGIARAFAEQFGKCL